jgi:chloramphenicol-sensitive protein RarD
MLYSESGGLVSKGNWYAVGAYGTWGLFPLYWKLLTTVPALQLIGHRVLWSCLLLMGILAASGQWVAFRARSFDRRTLLIYGGAGVLIGFNWLIYVWAVNAGFIVETSLGYFINPLVSILLGVFILGERLRIGQWIPIGLAASGVIYLTFVYGSLPWISLVLACTFGLYGLVKKVAPLGSTQGLALETLLLVGPALVYLVFEDMQGRGAFLRGNLSEDLLMAGSGVVTTVPLLLFTAAARRIPLTMIGLFQYMAPTLQFLIGVFVFHETFTTERLIGFSMVWFALALSAGENVLALRAQRAAAR